MKKRVFLLAVSCKKGGLCPGGIDLDNPSEWIRIVKDNGEAGSVQGFEIDFANPLDIIEFDGHPVPLGLQKENWAIDNNSCVKVGTDNSLENFIKTYNAYGYHGFWGNDIAYLNEAEASLVKAPSESIMAVTNVRIYKNNYDKYKIDFRWICNNKIHYISGISLTDQEFYGHDNLYYERAVIVVSIPSAADWKASPQEEGRAYKFVSKVFPNVSI